MSDELERVIPTKDEAVNFTADMRDAFDNFGDAASKALEFLRKSQEIDYWRGYEGDYSDWLDWYHTEMEDQLDYLKELKLDIDIRAGLIQTLDAGGLTKKEIAETTGSSRSTVYRALAQQDDHVSRDTSTQVDAAGQSVEEVGHIDDDSVSSPFVPDDEPPVVKMSQVFHNDNQEPYSAPNSIDDRFAGIDFAGMVISGPSPQIIETAPSPDTSDYFVPRSPAPSWSPPQVTELPPPSRKAYDDGSDNTPEFLEPPMKLQKVGEDKKEPTDKHCLTCACNLLP